MGKYTFLIVALLLLVEPSVIQAAGHYGVSRRLVMHTKVMPEEKDLLADISPLQNESQMRELLRITKDQLLQRPADPLLLKRAAYLHFRLGWLYSKNVVRKEHYLKFFDLASKAHDATGGDYSSSLLLAVSKAKIIKYHSNAEQVQFACEAVEEAKDLIDWRENDPDALHLLSWLNFGIGRVSSINKLLASLFFGGLPEGMTIDNAIALMEQLIQLRPDYSVYRYDLGYYYWHAGEKEKAAEQFRQVLSMAPKTPEEYVFQEKAADKLDKIEY